jgi:hypothetical protein
MAVLAPTLEVLQDFGIETVRLEWDAPGQLEKLWLQARTRPPSPSSVAVRLLVEWARKLRAGDLGLADTLPFLQSRLGLARVGQIPAHLLTLIRQALKGKRPERSRPALPDSG